MRWLTPEEATELLTYQRDQPCSTLSRTALGSRGSSGGEPERRPFAEPAARRRTGRPSRRETSARTSAPASSVRARSGRRPRASATRPTGGRRASRRLLELVGAVLVADERASARALPPVASATSGCGGSSAARPSRTASRAASTRRPSAGRRGAARRSAAASRGRPSAPRPARQPVPTTISVEPPPTSQTATVLGRDSRARLRPRRRAGPPPRRRGPGPRRRSRGRARRAGARRVALAARRGDDHLDLADAELARDPRVPPVTSRASSSLPRRTRPCRRISSPRPRYARSSRTRADAAPSPRNEQPHRVRAHVDHRDAHAGILAAPRSDPRAVTDRCCEPPPARRVRSRARRCRLS